MNVNEFSNKVADYLETYGHNQDGHYYLNTTAASVAYPCPACVLGAAGHVAGIPAPNVGGIGRAESEPDSQWYHHLAVAIYPTESVVDWSDSTPTEEVIATLRGLGK